MGNVSSSVLSGSSASVPQSCVGRLAEKKLKSWQMKCAIIIAVVAEKLMPDDVVRSLSGIASSITFGIQAVQYEAYW